jgi:hypothetical protein
MREANNQDDLDMDPPPPRRHQAGPSNIFNQIMGGMGGLGAAGGFGGFHRAAPPEYIVRTDRRNLADGIGLMMIISRHTRWRLWIEKIGLSCCMVARVSCIEGGERNEADEIVVMPPSALAKLCTSPSLLQ